MRKINILFLVFILTTSVFGLQNNTINKASEEKEISKTKDPLKKASLHLKFADKRIHLIQHKGGKSKLIAKGNMEELYPLINEYLENINKSYSEITKAKALGRNTSSSLDIVNQATTKHLEVLNRVLAKVPEQAKDAIRHAIEVSQKGHQKALGNSSKNNKKSSKKLNKNKGKGKALGKQKTKGHPNKVKKKKKKST